MTNPECRTGRGGHRPRRYFDWVTLATALGRQCASTWLEAGQIDANVEEQPKITGKSEHSPPLRINRLALRSALPILVMVMVKRSR